MFYSVWDKVNKQENLFYREISPVTGDFIDEGKLLISVKGKIVGAWAGTGKLYGIQTVNKFKIYTSYDSTRLLVWYRKHPEKRNDAVNTDVIGFNVFDEQLNNLWNKEVRMPYPEEKMYDTEYLVDNKGVVYILSTVFNDKVSKKRLKDGKPNYNIELFKVQSGNNDIEIFSTSLDEGLITSISIIQSDNDYLSFGGFYTTSKKKISDVKGLFYFRFDKNGNLVNKSVFDFPIDFLNSHASNKTIKKNSKKDKDNKAQFDDLVMRKMDVNPDGSIILFGEQFFGITSTSGTGKDTRTVTKYFYNYIVAAKITSDGKLAWLKNLPKIQKSTTYGSIDLGFKHINHNNNHYILFVDRIENLRLEANEKPKTYLAGSRGILSRYKINDTTGEISKAHVLNTKEVRGVSIYQFDMDRVFFVDDDEYVIEVYKKKKEDILIKSSKKKKRRQ